MLHLAVEASAILGAHVEGFHEEHEPAVRSVGAVDGPAIVADSTFAPAGDRLPDEGEEVELAGVRFAVLGAADAQIQELRLVSEPEAASGR